jgi:hypothetical protein
VSSAERKPSSEATEIEAQKRSNRSSAALRDAFAGHREHGTALVLAAAAPGARLCVLGAGNCLDLDLEKLAERYQEIHLVDIDDGAVRAAFERQSPDIRAKVSVHAPVDISGFGGRLDRWAAGSVTPDEILRHPTTVCEDLARVLPAPFDVVVSSCVLTQIQLTLLHVLSDAHRLFEPLREMSGLAHLRAIATLTAQGGRAILATDVASSVDGSLDPGAERRDARDVLRETIVAGRAIDVADPRHLAWLARVDPMLARTVRVSEPVAAWWWQNGPERTFLVYAIELLR